MNIRLSLSLIASLMLAACATGTDDGGGTVDSAEAAQTARVKVFLKNTGPRPIVLFDATDTRISGGTGPRETSTFDPLALGTYTVKNDQTHKVGTIVVRASDGPEVTWACNAEGCAMEEKPTVDPGTPPAESRPASLNVQLVFGQSGHKLFAYPDLDHLDRKIWAVAGNRAWHDLPAGKTIGLDVWNIDRPGDKSGEWRTFDIPADARFDRGVLSCTLAIGRRIDCTLASADGSVVTRGDGAIGPAVRP